jgi:hypothetical protein
VVKINIKNQTINIWGQREYITRVFDHFLLKTNFILGFNFQQALQIATMPVVNTSLP